MNWYLFQHGGYCFISYTLGKHDMVGPLDLCNLVENLINLWPACVQVPYMRKVFLY